MWILIFASLFPFVSVFLYFVWAGSTSETQALYGITKIIQFGFPFLIWKLRGEALGPKFRVFPISKQQVFLAFGTSAFFLSVGAASYFLAMEKYVNNADTKLAILDRLQAFGADTVGTFLFLGFFIAIIHSFLEEYYWRLFVHAEMVKFAKPRFAVILSTLAFTLHHVIVVNQYAVSEPKALFIGLGTFAVFACGCIWTLQYQKTKSLFVVWCSHVVADIVALGIGFHIVFA
jgi:uncharacterized protein